MTIASSSPPSSRRDLRAGLLLALFCLLVYNANLRGIGAGDTLPARYLPFGLWHHGTLVLDPIRDSVAESSPAPYWIVPGREGRAISMYPVALPVLVAPLYLPAVAYLHFEGWTEWRLQRVAIVMEKVAASLLAATAAGLFYLLVRRRAPPRDALLLALVFALGTNTWMIGSQALWQHGLAELLLVGSLLLLTGRCTRWRALTLGVLLALVVCNRPPDALLAAPLALVGLSWRGRRAAGWMVAGAALPLGLVLLYNLAAAGNLLGGYGIPGRANYFRFDLLSGSAGILFSPARGLFVFTPVLLFVAVALRPGLRDRSARALTLAICAGCVALVLFYAKADWRAGWSWGPRWLTDLLPLLVWLLPPGLAALRGLGRALFVAAACASVAVQAVGAFWYIGASEPAIYVGVPGPDEMRGAWEPRNAPFLAELRHPRAPVDPAFLPWRKLAVRGMLDRVNGGDGPNGALPFGAPLTLEGWALENGLAPAAVEATLDGRLRGTTETFVDRGDVRAAMGTTAKAGWQLAVDTRDVRPGDHALVLRARLRDSALAVPFAWRWITLVEPATGAASAARRSTGVDSLSEAARRAAQALRDHQQPAGFWLTQYTAAPRFEAPHPEMNTFLTAMTVDLLTPVASRADLGPTLDRAREHLRAQIEEDGLVRYHGRPDGPTIGTLGCRITPDADDTALVWRLAPGDRARLPSALSGIARYRTSSGLYRTWLAPRQRYECLDPGRDPNPTDVAIQMHVYLFLAQADRAAARSLCRALRPAVEDEAHWVYYRQAPLVPLLRSADLARAGCALRLPPARLETTVPGQEAWLDAARALAATAGNGEQAPSPAATAALLRELAADDFARLRTGPPLLYHNDLTAGTPRFYWSEDFGYALWLRLYDDGGRERRVGREHS